ncbi:hypothetical protein FRUB_02992 [Fimbriiglobus ruber]|uniref:Uncharacterized protein n=1 Tax=Fimbriiglobus ruber TaxID=1908690 RepID=A0A225DQM4_9BACT|nr:hypothetical protein FRUB_02992 [Fimbriiglobus ruber]
MAPLQFFLNHRRFARRERASAGGSQSGRLADRTVTHPHWLELLGFTRFSRT